MSLRSFFTAMVLGVKGLVIIDILLIMDCIVVTVFYQIRGNTIGTVLAALMCE